MSSRLVLADSSAWVTHLTGQRAALATAMTDLLNANRIVVNDVIRCEILTGALNESQYAELADALQGLPMLPLTDSVWRRAERLRFKLRCHGALIPLPDVLIACCALVHDCEVLHSDRYFDVMARTASLKIHRVVRGAS